MSLSHSPKVVTDGLVFYYDMSNTKKSWIGAPTTNLLVSQSLSYSLYAYVTGPVITPTFDQNNISVTAQRYTISTVVNTARAAFYPTSLTTGVDYIFSCYIRYNGNNVAVPGLYADASKGNPEGGANNNTFNSSSVTATLVGNNWYYLVYKFNYATCPTGKCVLAFGLSTGSDTAYLNNTFDVYNAQLETGTFATPYSNGVRSNTGAIVDLTNNNTITATSLTYNSDGSFSFNNINDVIETNFPAQTLNNSTICAWVYDNTTDTNYRSIVQNNVASDDALYVNPSNYLMWWPATSSSLIVPKNQWVFVSASHTYGSGILYQVNGTQQLVSGTFADPTDWDFLRIGGHSTGDGERWGGKIAVVQVYNRALTAAEVQQNFIALRGRYGI